MDVETVSTADQSLIRAVRETMANSDDVFLCVAFVQDAGVRLVEKELAALRARRARTRMLVTTTFGTTSSTSLRMASDLGVDVRVLNPGGGRSFHPKIYLGAMGAATRAVIGSANLTGGLFTNVEMAVCLRGTQKDAALAEAWRWAEDRWSDRRVDRWQTEGVSEPPANEVIDPVLRRLIDAERTRDPMFHTLGTSPKPNRIIDVTASAVYVETDRSVREQGGPAAIPAWMFNLAWERLRTHGKLTNTELLNGLRVHRSSAVCAILARLPGVSVRGGGAITLLWLGNGGAA
jgi:HKD family nuclease